MPFRFDTEEEVKPRRRTAAAAERSEGNDTEIALGTRSLVAIFFGLVLICALFFGLGYSVGRAGGSRDVAQASPGSASTAPNSHLAKPSADQTLTPVEPAPAASDSGVPTTDASATQSDPANPQPAATSPTASGSATTPAPAMTAQKPAATVAAPPSAAGATLQPAAATSAASFMVQVAAVRVSQDAQILVDALKKHGYSAVVRNEPQDQLLHIQLGPYPSRSDAMAMRAKLLADGYNAVVK
ncbi:MAG: SPOR domain-containing protein [Acidobacteriota bacterium]